MERWCSQGPQAHPPHGHTGLSGSPGSMWTHPRGLGSRHWMAAAQCSSQPNVAPTWPCPVPPRLPQGAGAGRGTTGTPSVPPFPELWIRDLVAPCTAVPHTVQIYPHEPSAVSLPAGPSSPFHYLLSFPSETTFYLKKATKSKRSCS